VTVPIVDRPTATRGEREGPWGPRGVRPGPDALAEPGLSRPPM